MSYVLCLGFKSISYKEPVSVDLYLNNLFLHNFTLDTTDNKVTAVKDILFSSDYYDFRKKLNFLDNKPKLLNFTKSEMSKDICFKFIELNEENIQKDKKNHIRFDVFADSNNYTNGFLTKNTMILVAIVYLVPKNFLLDPESFHNEYLLKILQLKRKHSDCDEIKKFYSKTMTLFDLYCNFDWYNNNTNLIEKKRIFEWIGGNGYFKLSFDKQILSLDSDADKFDLHTPVLYGLSNKYKQYENQRNTN